MPQKCPRRAICRPVLDTTALDHTENYLDREELRMNQFCMMKKLFTIQKRKLEYLRRNIKDLRYIILHLNSQGNIEGKRSIERRRISWFKNLRE